MDDPKASPEKIKVVDRRRFTDEGELRRDSEKPEQPVSEPAPAVAAEEKTADMPPAQAEQTTRPPSGPETAPHLFLELVAMLAHQAELLISGAEDLPAQPAEARRVIDYLGVLEEKTRGNLSPDEAQALSNILYQLRAVFVQSQK